MIRKNKIKPLNPKEAGVELLFLFLLPSFFFVIFYYPRPLASVCVRLDGPSYRVFTGFFFWSASAGSVETESRGFAFLPSFYLVSLFFVGFPPPLLIHPCPILLGFFFTEFLKEEGGGVRSTHPSIDALHFSYRFYLRTTSSSVGIFASKKSFCFCFIFFFCDRLSSSFIGRHQVVCGGPLASVCYRVFFFSLSLSSFFLLPSFTGFFFPALLGFTGIYLV